MNVSDSSLFFETKHPSLDGSHQSDEDFTYFHLPPVKSRKDVDKTLFGISCNRQILTKDLLVKTDDVTRSSVQKAVVVLATQVLSCAHMLCC